MRHHKRRETGSFPYYKLATFDAGLMCFRDGKKAFPTSEAAERSVPGAGRYRLSMVTSEGRTDLPPFNVDMSGSIHR
jgi:hypothetical protein